MKRRKKNTVNKLHVKKGEQVEVISGNDRGKRGRVLMVFPKQNKVLVEGVNKVMKHQKPTQENPKGGRMEQEMAVHASNVLPVDPTSGEASRIGRRKIDESGKSRWVRVSKYSGETLDN